MTKTLIALMVLPLIACEAPFEARQDVAVQGEAGATDEMTGTGGSTAGGSTAGASIGGSSGKAGAPNNTAGKDSGTAGSPDETGGTGGTTAGASSVAGGTSTGGSAGSGMAGAPTAGMGQGGTDSGTGGTGGTTIDWCSASAHDANWADVTWNSNVTGLCDTQDNYISKGLLTLKLPSNCAWEYDPSSSDSWQGCRFTNSVSCTALGSLPAFSVQVTSQFMGTTGQLNGTLYYQAETAGACATVSMVGFSGQRDL